VVRDDQIDRLAKADARGLGRRIVEDDPTPPRGLREGDARGWEQVQQHVKNEEKPD